MAYGAVRASHMGFFVPKFVPWDILMNMPWTSQWPYVGGVRREGYEVALFGLKHRGMTALLKSIPLDCRF